MHSDAPFESVIAADYESTPVRMPVPSFAGGADLSDCLAVRSEELEQAERALRSKESGQDYASGTFMVALWTAAASSPLRGDGATSEATSAGTHRDWESGMREGVIMRLSDLPLEAAVIAYRLSANEWNRAERVDTDAKPELYRRAHYWAEKAEFVIRQARLSDEWQLLPELSMGALACVRGACVARLHEALAIIAIKRAEVQMDRSARLHDMAIGSLAVAYRSWKDACSAMDRAPEAARSCTMAHEIRDARAVCIAHMLRLFLSGPKTGPRPDRVEGVDARVKKNVEYMSRVVYELQDTRDHGMLALFTAELDSMKTLCGGVSPSRADAPDLSGDELCSKVPPVQQMTPKTPADELLPLDVAIVFT